MMGKIIILFALTLASAYSFVLLISFLGLFKVKRKRYHMLPACDSVKRQEYTPYFVSVVLAARNEEENIARCLESLLNQTYPEELYEVILVDDRSTDSTFSIAESFAKNDRRLKLLHTTEHHILTGKQNGLDIGIRASKGEIILTTDADCEAPPNWIQDTVREFEPDVGLVAGYSIFKEDISHQGVLQRVFIRLQLFELLGQYFLSIGSMSQGIVWTCTGNNLAYRRRIYDELGGYENLGLVVLEDNMLLQWVDKHSKWRVKPVCNMVYIEPAKTVRQFFTQRIRWASSALQYRLSLVSFMVIAYGLNLLLPFLIGLSAFGIISYRGLIIFLSLKIVPEFLLALKGLTLFGKVGLIKYFPLLQVLHVIYVLICGIHALSGKFDWKGREYREVKAESDVQDAK